MKLGRFHIDAFTDGTFTLDGGQVFGIVPKPLWEKKLPSDARNRVRMSLTCLLVQTEKLNVLIETGIGDQFDPKRADIYGVDHSVTSLPAELQKRTSHRMTSRSSSIRTCISTTAAGTRAARDRNGSRCFHARVTLCNAASGNMPSRPRSVIAQATSNSSSRRPKNRRIFWKATRN